MSNKYLDSNGLSYFWEKIQDSIQSSGGSSVSPGIFNNLTYFDYSDTDLRDDIPLTGQFYPSGLEKVPINTYGYICLPNTAIPGNASYTGQISWAYSNSRITTARSVIRYAYFELDPDRPWSKNGVATRRDRLFIYFTNTDNDPWKLKDTYIRLGIYNSSSNYNSWSSEIIRLFQDTTYTAGTGIDITNGVISATGGSGSGEAGQDGITPEVIVTSITGGHNVAFNYGTGDARNTDFNVMDGSDGAAAPTYTAGTGISISNGVISLSLANGEAVSY